MGEEKKALETEGWGQVAETDFCDVDEEKIQIIESGLEEIRKIESHTQSDVKFELMLIGIDQNSGSWED